MSVSSARAISADTLFRAGYTISFFCTCNFLQHVFLSREHNFLGPFLHACNFCRQLTNFFGRSARWPLVFAFSTICTNHMIDAYSFHGFGKSTHIWDILTFCNVSSTYHQGFEEVAFVKLKT